MSEKPGHAVNRLRDEAVARSTRPFKARGARVQRCPGCQLARWACICAERPQLDCAISFCLIMHAYEPLKPTNTGRLIADCLPDTHAFEWARTEVDPALLALLADPQYQPYVVFPGEYAQPGQQVCAAIEPEPGRRPLLIILDATWTQARKMFRKSPYLADLPILSLHTERLSRYRLRRSSRDDHLCTVEVAAACLALAAEEIAARQLDDYFDLFSRGYMDSCRRRPQ
ncbi:DTW domain-containing protein [Halopseudomonas aestusnigri]|jgi:DTW domain-containing protein YfiP|uniref:tRNA-uridine aminocarboxypropyltransferase n=1 Tax=Halopseudomonas aestusnigri TaxID=857252 RepID=UPI000C8DA451|nr:DTW domain-containing protein [Halopseudomonas aestusnigri]MAP76467.1 DTW domain-containing protein [Pseudomonadales bacterium]MEE2799115.1 DTW domain-containing protein [Pseudomonadota bacterium]MCC4262160.1 DTW domain-containing protein [Halopseudomonas aestusnigri]MCK5529965.1 DTW domain-containing protein [Halopseudomonas aestusnigri]UGV31609.1 DTW domain-containing protein [Halopseudomonas aestusnigri]|tara:strand:- start:789 stop:1472 length:684 start_codon:yes stop_codon:yes gene_type:complete